MITLGVIKRVEEPTYWVNSMVYVKKNNGELRVCMDPKDLNGNIKREHYQIPKQEIMSEMSGARYFTKLDASKGFRQIRLDDDVDILSSDYLLELSLHQKYFTERWRISSKGLKESEYILMASLFGGLHCKSTIED